MKLETKNSKKINVRLVRIEKIEIIYAVYVDSKGKEYKYILSESKKK